VAKRPHIIILNGVGSVGKTSAARAFQRIAAETFLYASMDTFIEMLPERMFGHPDGMIFEAGQENGRPSIAIKCGPAIGRTLKGMRHAIAAMAEQGNNLIVDDVMIGEGEAQEYQLLLSKFDLRMVGLFAPLDVLEAREHARGDREIGLARWQFDLVHRGVTYDLELDAASSTPMQIAERIRAAFGL
jgi:chloramphenicol 3-O phosphotransferase